MGSSSEVFQRTASSAFNDIHSCGQMYVSGGNYSKLPITTNLVLHKYLSLDIIKFAFYSGIWTAVRGVFTIVLFGAQAPP